jgi:predicted thioredoxin/glutaredoxin
MINIAGGTSASALFALSNSVESMTDTDPNEAAARSRHVLTGPQSMIDVVMDRAEGFLSQQRDRFVQELSENCDREPHAQDR